MNFYRCIKNNGVPEGHGHAIKRTCWPTLDSHKKKTMWINECTVKSVHTPCGVRTPWPPRVAFELSFVGWSKFLYLNPDLDVLVWRYASFGLSVVYFARDIVEHNTMLLHCELWPPHSTRAPARTRTSCIKLFSHWQNPLAATKKGHKIDRFWLFCSELFSLVT